VIRAALLALLLAGCAATPMPGPPTVERQYPPVEWLEGCPAAERADRSNAALIAAYLANLESLAQCDDDKARLRRWRETGGLP
jgi:hypothetical protein